MMTILSPLSCPLYSLLTMPGVSPSLKYLPETLSDKEKLNLLDDIQYTSVIKNAWVDGWTCGCDQNVKMMQIFFSLSAASLAASQCDQRAGADTSHHHLTAHSAAQLSVGHQTGKTCTEEH